MLLNERNHLESIKQFEDAIEILKIHRQYSRYLDAKIHAQLGKALFGIFRYEEAMESYKTAVFLFKNIIPNDETEIKKLNKNINKCEKMIAQEQSG